MVLTAHFATPGGHTAVMGYRPDTSDWNTIAACLVNPMNPATGDEYHLPRDLEGWGLDVGAHIGAVTIGLLLDNPQIRVLAIEAVPANIELLNDNLLANGVMGRAVVFAGAAWNGRGWMTVQFNYRGSETALVHRWIGSVTPWMDSQGHDETRVPIINLTDALRYTDGAGFVWAKSDCEGCEHRFFRGRGLRKIGHIVGEWHYRDGSPEDFAAQLGKTHEVTWGEGIGGGPFTAVRR